MSLNDAAAQGFCPVSELHPTIAHSRVAGIIIGKTDVRSFPDRKNIGFDRFTFGFTIKDSPDSFINVSSWGNDGYINSLSGSFTIGDCVVIESPLVATKDPEKENRYCPATPGAYRLLVSEAHSRVCLCADTEVIDRLLPLLYLPVKDSRDFYTLGDIVANGQGLEGRIAEAKQFSYSDGRQGHRLEAKLFDYSISSFPLVCWDREAIQLVQTLKPKETVLFIADAKIGFDNFRNCMAASVNSKTIITVNPDTKEASLLFSYAKETAESGALDDDGDRQGDVPVDAISDVYTVNQMKLKAQESPDVFFGITYSFITRLDLHSKVIRTKCARCRYQVNEELQSCSNPLCPGKGQALTVTTEFDLMVNLTDHTGTLLGCSLKSPVPEKMFGCTMDEFSSVTDEQLTAIKWRFLLERCKIYVKILPSTKMRTGVRGTILDCSLADPGEVKQHMSALL